MKLKNSEEQMLKESKIKFLKFPFMLNMLKNIIKKEGNKCFYCEEMTVKTNLGDYKVSTKLFNTKNYNEFVMAMANILITGKNSSLLKKKPSINHVCDVIDDYIRTNLFDEPFDPYVDNNWQILKIAKVGIVEYIIIEVSKLIYGLSIEKLIKIIKTLKETIIKHEKTIMQQEEKIIQIYQELADRQIQNNTLEKKLEELKKEKLKIEEQTKNEREQKIDEILKITKNIEGYINTQTKC
jgi:hypothetical protein